MERSARKANRLTSYDYSLPGAYFITVCADHRRCLFSDVGAIRESPLRQRSLISKVVGYFKMNVTRKIHAYNPDEIVWQRSFYDHVIRTEQDYQDVWQYIDNNPAQWCLDRLCQKEGDG